MTSFTSLLNVPAGDSAGHCQELARRQFPRLITMSHLRLWQPGDPVVAVPIRVLVGVATYSALDLRLLEIIDRKLEEASRNGATLHVEVFNVLECRDQADFEKYIPGIGTVFQTPVVGIWENGVLVHRATGAAARSLLESRLNTDLDQIES